MTSQIEPCVVLWQAMNEAEKVGNRTDDKLIVEFLRRAGYCIATAPAPEATPAPAPAYVIRTVVRMLPGAIAMGWISDAERKNVEEWLAATPAQAQQADLLPSVEHIKELAQEAFDQVMEQAQVFASAWSLVGGRFDTGNAMDDAEEAKAELRTMVRSLADLAAHTVRPLAATKADAKPLPEGWKFNHARQQTDDDGPVEGVWEIGWLEVDDNYFAPIVTVDTGLYYQDKEAEPLAQAILARLAGIGASTGGNGNGH